MRLPIRYNMRSLAQRRVRSLLTAVGVGTAIFISIMMVALSRGLIESTSNSSSPENVIVLSKGAESMEFSAIDPAVFQRINGSLSGGSIASPEAYLSSFVRFDDGEKRGVIRGVRPIVLKVQDRVRIVQGQAPDRGFQVMIGKLAATKLGVPQEALALGKSIDFEGQRWKIVGHFEAPGTMLESEIWGHLDDVLTASKRTDYSAVSIRTPNPSAAEDVVFDLVTRTDIRVEARSESAYYAEMAKALRPVQVVSVTMTVILVLGAVLVGMNTMFTSILGRTREMAVLLVLGYKRKAILISFVLESVALCLLGGVLGAVLGATLNGLPMKIPMGAFRFAVDGLTLGLGIGMAILVGVLGAVVPVMRVARLEIVQALRME